MRESLPQSRRAHYSALAGLLIVMTLLGVVTLRCARGTMPGGSLVPKEGVKTSEVTGIEFDENVGSADYELDATFTRPDEDETEATCTWRAVKSLEPMRTATGLEDFEPADSSVSLQGNFATIKVTPEKPRRTVFFVCEYQVGRKVRFKSHVIRVKNNF